MFPISIDFLINIALNLASKIHQKSTQEAPKINKNSITNNIQHMIPFFIDFSRFWRPLGPQVGPMLGLCWPQKPQKGDLQNNTKKHTKNRRSRKNPRRSGNPVLGSPNYTENNPVQATGTENTPSQLALWRIYLLIYLSI